MLRFEGVFIVHELRRHGLAIAEIARRDRKTPRKYLQRGVEQPRYRPRALQPRKIDPYLDYIRARLETYPMLSAMWWRVRFASADIREGGLAVTQVVAAVIGTGFLQEHQQDAQRQWRETADKLRGRFAKLADLMDDAEHDVPEFMAFPKEHRSQIASTNPLERVNNEIKRRPRWRASSPTTPPSCAWSARC